MSDRVVVMRRGEKVGDVATAKLKSADAIVSADHRRDGTMDRSADAVRSRCARNRGHDGMSSKLVPMNAALDAIRDGMSITAGGFAHSHQPMALLRALIKRGIRNITLMGVAECWVAEFLAAANALDRSYFSNFMFEGFGRCRRFSEGVESGAIEVEDHSHFGMVNRLGAAAMGLPFMPMRAMSGTDILAKPGFEEPQAKSRLIESPFDARDRVLAVSPLKPDVAIIHAARATKQGNVQLYGPTSVIVEQARAASHVIVSVEEIVDTSVIRRHPEFTVLPACWSMPVVHAPFGAHPLGNFGYYQHDHAHLEDYYDAFPHAAIHAGVSRRMDSRARRSLGVSRQNRYRPAHEAACRSRAGLHSGGGAFMADIKPGIQPDEYMAVAAAREIRNGDVAFIRHRPADGRRVSRESHACARCEAGVRIRHRRSAAARTSRAASATTASCTARR
ncbi:hypothetical protein L0Z14_19075 [Burkholderia multivorans]|uniref:CoA transferase subunit A n=1 Tax=Burkholderia multivorans TaxID=87883 RepID=UPI00201B024B|nr:CoA-transferase [Burkholderia multivorans]MCL4663027.1 hypothetical protein [Burkholderia multivorans]